MRLTEEEASITTQVMWARLGAHVDMVGYMGGRGWDMQIWLGIWVGEAGDACRYGWVYGVCPLCPSGPVMGLVSYQLHRRVLGRASLASCCWLADCSPWTGTTLPWLWVYRESEVAAQFLLPSSNHSILFTLPFCLCLCLWLCLSLLLQVIDASCGVALGGSPGGGEVSV